MSFSESGSLGNSSASDVTSLSSQLPDTPNSMVHSPIDTWRGQERSSRGPRTGDFHRTRRDVSLIQLKKGSTEPKWIIYLPAEGFWGGLFPSHSCLSRTGVDGGHCGTPQTKVGSDLWDSSPELYGTLKVTGSRPQTSMDQERQETNCVDRCAWVVSFSMDSCPVSEWNRCYAHRSVPTNKLLLFIKTDIADLINKTVVKSEFWMHDWFDFECKLGDTLTSHGIKTGIIYKKL